MGGDAGDRLAGSRPLGLYTERNLCFPYARLVAELRRRRPQLPAAVGDQCYEHRPTTKERAPEPTLDVLYRWYLWLWASRDLTRSVPTVVLVDDDDVYHPNLWGNAGAPAPRGRPPPGRVQPLRRRRGRGWAPGRPGAGQAGRGAALSGDQHLASVVGHGLDGFDDGPVQFVAPAAGSAWQRRFEPAGGLPNPGATPHTGDFTDAYGNRMRVLAVANPKLTKAAFRAAGRGRNAELGDRDRKRQGYGLVRVDKRRRRFVIECWPWDGGPRSRAGPTSCRSPRCSRRAGPRRPSARGRGPPPRG